jgi:diaminohydroxyphosphoribosylaminopyrimidine deaminase/5-amino-6-(5-phosphoribosylamino)uracil reductase
LVLTSERAHSDAVDAWRAAGAKVEVVPVSDTGHGLDLEAVLALLGAQDVLQAMFEGGARVHGALQQRGLADRVVAYVAPFLLGTDGLPAFVWQGPRTLDTAPRLVLDSVARIDDDVRLEYRRSVEAA